MKIISLSSSIAGPACAIGLCIKKHFYDNNYQTNMFDYLEISLLSIIQILYLKNDDINYLHENNEVFINPVGNNSVIFKNFNHIISHHDLKLNYSEEDYKDFIDKYKRRYHRLMEYINTEDKILFIRYGNELESVINNFMNRINEINPKLQVFFINVNYDEKSEIVNYNIKNVFYINFYNHIDKNVIYNDNLFYKTMQYDWNIISDVISNISK